MSRSRNHAVHWGLAAALILGPAVRTWAADEAVPSTPTAQAAGAPALPDVQTEEKAAPEVTGAQAAPAVPQDALPQPGAAKPEAKPGKFKMTNFLLGFLGGALLGGAYGILSDDSGNPKTRDAMAGVDAAIGGISLGTLSLLLGATTPEEVKPPRVEGRRPGVPGVQLTLLF